MRNRLHQFKISARNLKSAAALYKLTPALLMAILAGSSFQLPYQDNKTGKGPIGEKAGWLIGTWEMKTPEGSIFETWTEKNDRELTGKSYTVKGKDTLVLETVQLVLKPEGLFYIPTVKNQNEGAAITFQSLSGTGQELVFENPAHDFPQKISYKLLTKDSLLAVISGTLNGRQKARQFPMRKIK